MDPSIAFGCKPVWARTKPRAFSLIEVVVAGSVMLGLLSILYLIAVAGLQLFMQTRAYQGVQQEILKGISRLTRDLSNSCKEHLSYDNGFNPYLRFLSPERPAPENGFEYDPQSARLRWWKWLCYFAEPQGNLVRAEVALTGGPITQLVPAPSPIPALAAFQAQTAPALLVVARQVELFQVTPNPQGSSLLIKVVTHEQTSSRAVTRFTLETQVTVLNR